MKSTEETQPQTLTQQTPMHSIQSVFEPYLITSGRCFGTTCTITRTNITGCAASPISTSLGSPSVGRQICMTGFGCTPMFGSLPSRSLTGGQGSALVSQRAFWYSGELPLWSFDAFCMYPGWVCWICCVLTFCFKKVYIHISRWQLLLFGDILS